MRRIASSLTALFLACAPVEGPAPAVAPPAPVAVIATAPRPPRTNVPPIPTLAEDPALATEPIAAEAPGRRAEPLPIAEAAEDEDKPEPRGASQESAGDGEGSTEPAEAVVAEPEEVDFDPGGRSLRVRRSITVRADPREDADPIGTLAQDVRVAWVKAVKGPGCDAWVEISPRGWICARYLEGNFRAPRARELPLLPEGTLTPGVYARIVGSRARAYPNLSSARRRRHSHRIRGARTVRLSWPVRVHHRRFWRTSDGEYIEARFLRRFHPSDFAGLDSAQLSTRALPLAWAQSRRHPGRRVGVRAGPSEHAPQSGPPLPLRTVVSLLRLSWDGRWAEIAEGRWVSMDDLHVARLAPPPEGAGGEDRWLDVDLDEQVLVAYQGARPAYATLISSGGPEHPTPEGLFRIWIKFAEVDMKGEEPGVRPYKVATVPWVMFFQGDFALHTAYWHDHFGRAVSHGCLNLSPRDARALYGWTAPKVPDGWSMVYASDAQKGSLVRIHRGPLPAAHPAGALVCSVAAGL